MSQLSIPTRAPTKSITSMKSQAAVLRAISHVVLIIFTLIVIYPVIWMVFASLKDRAEILGNIWGPPQAMAFENYTKAWERAQLGFALLNSVIISLATVTLVTLFAALAGYALARFKFRFATVILLIFVLTMQAPVPIIPLYVMLVRLGLTNSYPALILPMVAGGLPLSIFIFQAYFRTVPRELHEAAIVDGCTQLQAFLRIIIPISAPVFATIAILQFLGSWNEYFLPLILVRSPELRTLPLAIQVFFYDWGRSEWEQVFAALTIGSLPMIVVYILMQRQFIQGLTSGAVKG